MPEILDEGLFGEPKVPTGDFEFYRDFFNAEQASAFAELLRQHKITFKLEKTKALVDSTFTGHGFMPHAILKIQVSDFGRVNQILEDNALNDEGFIANHYFQEYNASELLEVVLKPDEWTPEDVAVARHLLAVQGVGIPEKQVETFKQQRIDTLRAGKKASIAWVIVYLFFVVVGAILLSPFFMIGGLGMGWYYWKDKSIDADGQRYFTFEPASRKMGKWLFILGCLLQAVALLLYMYLPYRSGLF